VHCQAGAEAVQGTIINADLAVTDGKLVRFGQSVASDVFEKVLTHGLGLFAPSEAPHDTVFAKQLTGLILLSDWLDPDCICRPNAFASISKRSE
jgi:hypothetical protein